MTIQQTSILAAHRLCCPWYSDPQGYCFVQPGKPIRCNDNCKYMWQFIAIIDADAAREKEDTSENPNNTGRTNV